MLAPHLHRSDQQARGRAARQRACREATFLVIAGRRNGSTAEHEATLDQLRELARRHGAKLAHTGQGSAMALLCTGERLADAVSRTARCALEIRASNTDVPLAMATGRGRPSRDVLKRALQMWTEGQSSPSLPHNVTTPATPLPIGSPIEAIAGELMTGRFEVTNASRPGSGDRLAGDRSTGNHSAMLAPRSSSRHRKPKNGLRFPHLAGRERELAAIEANIDRCFAERRSQLTVVLGPAGSGKSRLRFELTERLKRSTRPPSIWLQQGEPTRASSPFGLLGRILRQALGLAVSDSITEHRKRLVERVCSRVASKDAERVAVFLSELLGAPVTDKNHPMLRAARADSRFMHEQIHWAWHDWLDAESTHEPVLILVDDAQWSDLVSLRFLASALRDLANRPIAVVAFARPEEPRAGQHRLGQLETDQLRSRVLVSTIQLEPLSDELGQKLVRHALPQASDLTVGRLVARADGNALHLEELVRAATTGARCDLPATIPEALAAHIASLSSRERRVLDAACVLGRSFRLAGVEAMVDDPPLAPTAGTATGTEASVRRLVDRGLLACDWRAGAAVDREYGFSSPVLRDVLYEALPADERAMLHHRAGRWLESIGETDGFVVATHYLHGSAPERAVPWLCRAAERALVAGNHRRALDLAARAQAHATSRELLGRLSVLQAEAYNLSCKYEAAYLCACNAMDLLPRGGAGWMRAARHLLWAANASERFAALSTPERALGAAPVTRPPTATGIDAHVTEALRLLDSRNAMLWLARGQELTSRSKSGYPGWSTPGSHGYATPRSRRFSDSLFGNPLRRGRRPSTLTN